MAELGINTGLRFGISKTHSKLEFLQPVIHVKTGVDEDLFAIPFNNIISFEYTVMEGSGQAVLELFDPTFRTLDVLMFNSVQAAVRGIPLKIRWGYSFTPQFEQLQSQFSNSSLSDRYMSQFYSFYPLVVHKEDQGAGTRLTVNLIPSIFDPVLTSIQVSDVFVSRKLNGPVDSTVLDKVASELVGGGNADESKKKYLAAINAYKKLINPAGKITPTTVPNTGGEVVALGDKLTASVIFNKLMDIAESRQTNLGQRRSERWQKPLVIMPKSLDDSYDYQVFEGRNDNIWQCLMRLARMMVSKTPTGSSDSIFNSQQTPASKPRNRMVGGRFTLHNAPLRNPASQATIRNANSQNIRFDQVPVQQQVFMLYQFTEAPYDFMLKTDDAPLATYVYYGGGKSYDPDNLPEIIEFRVTNQDALNAFFTNTQLFTVAAITNPDTGVFVQPALDSQSSVSQPMTGRTFEQLRAAQAADVDNNSYKAWQKGQSSPSNSITNPAQDKNGQQGAATNVASQVNTGSQATFDIPWVVSQDGENVSQAVDRFLDILRTKVGRLYYPEIEIEIVGDPLWEPTYVLDTTIRVVYRNRFGDENPIYSGIYFVRDIKHTIGTTYRTLLKCVKVQETAKVNEDPSISDAAASKNFKPGETIDLVLLKVEISGGGVGTPWKVKSINNVPSISDAGIATLSPENRKRINDTILPALASGKSVANTLADDLNSYLVNGFGDDGGKNLEFIFVQNRLTDRAKSITYTEGTQKRSSNFKVKIVNKG